MSRKTKRQELLVIVDWLLEHDDYSGLGMSIAEVIHDASVSRRWGADSVRAIFAAIAKHAPAHIVAELVTATKDCKKTIDEIERTRQAATLLGLDYDDVEKFVEQMRKQQGEQPAAAEVH